MELFSHLAISLPAPLPISRCRFHSIAKTPTNAAATDHHRRLHRLHRHCQHSLTPPPPEMVSKSNTNTGGDFGEEDPNHLQKLNISSYKWRLVIAYDGSRFSGWQYQESPPTIQCTIEKALARITKQERRDLHLVGASRTDTGVHAWGQVAHFVTPFNYDSLETLHAALNGLLPSDIRIREISSAASEFHARFSAKSKIYHYKIYSEPIMDPFQRHYAYHYVYKLNTEVMKEAAKLFLGKHDFSSFVNSSRDDRPRDPVKDIFRFDITETGPLLQLEVEGSGFLYRQVRNMVALLLQIGREAIPPEIVPKILAARDRKELARFALSAPPHGLCLVSVNYNEEHLQLPTGYPPATSFGRRSSISKCKLPFF
ncbi:tRNA pseudouridine(38-40) synthase [Sarracenia purpurea var. burkii]